MDENTTPGECAPRDYPARIVTCDWRAAYARRPRGRQEIALAAGAPVLYVVQGQAEQVTTLAALAAAGPVRPVTGPRRDEVTDLRTLARAAGTTTAVTLGDALGTVEAAWWDTTAHEVPEAGRTMSPLAPLTLGHPGSHESGALRRLVTYVRDARIPRTRAGVHAGLYEVAVAIFLRWVTDATEYVEAAGTLARTLAPVVDELGGWTAIADPLLRRDEVAGEVVAAWLCRHTDRHTPGKASPGAHEG